MASASPSPNAAPPRVLIFEPDARQAQAYHELFQAQGYEAETALPTDDVQALCERLQPDLVVFDMAIWEADTAYVFGVLLGALGFRRPVIIGLSTMDVQTRRARRFGADGVWVRGVDDATGLVRLAGQLLEKRRTGTLPIASPRTPL